MANEEGKQKGARGLLLTDPQNRYPEAWRSLNKLRFSPVQAGRDLYYAHVQLVEEQQLVNGASFFHRFVELFTVPRLRVSDRHQLLSL